ncbi:MAG: exonuclease SbcCD subunit D [Roseburia sp.]
MKFFHLSDLHIGKQLHHYNLCQEQRVMLSQIAEAAREEKPDAILIAGDIYDVAVPSAEAVSVFDAFLTELNNIEPQIPILLVAGNHDSARRIDFASNILIKNQLYIAGMPPIRPEEQIQKVTLTDEFGEVDFYLLPFVKPGYVRNLFEEEITGYDMAVRKLLEREKIDAGRRNVLVSHQFYTASGKEPEISDSEMHLVGGIENVDVSVLEPFDYVALGHIHRAQKIGKERYRYCGTPLQYSVSEAGDEKSITVVELKEKEREPIITTIPLEPVHKIRKITGTLEEVLQKTEWKEDYVSITLTDEIEAYRPKEQLEEVFSRILEIRIDNSRTRQILNMEEEEIQLENPFDAFQNFFEEMNGRELSEAENDLMKAVFQEEMGGEAE